MVGKSAAPFPVRIAASTRDDCILIASTPHARTALKLRIITSSNIPFDRRWIHV